MKLPILCLCALATAMLPARAADLYVSPAGLDTWSGHYDAPTAGRTDGPFATLERARDEIRRRRTAGEPNAPFTVQVRAGRYGLVHSAQTFAAPPRPVSPRLLSLPSSGGKFLLPHQTLPPDQPHCH